jgi:3D (Asp-Asp-Asp) domain-containing protein
MRHLHFILLGLAVSLLASCSSSGLFSAGKLGKGASRITAVRTTAYTHSESDHIIYGARTAVGSNLKYGNVRSAAADWSVYPVGTVFQIEGLPYVYQVDDYGSALVGTNTIDLYKPSKTEMNQWGVRNVNIRVLRWGSFSKSLSILKPRTHWGHVDKMADRIEKQRL